MVLSVFWLLNEKKYQNTRVFFSVQKGKVESKHHQPKFGYMRSPIEQVPGLTRAYSHQEYKTILSGKRNVKVVETNQFNYIFFL